MWLIIMIVTLVVAGLSLLYLANRVSKFGWIKNSNIRPWRKYLRGFLLVFFVFVCAGKTFNLVNAIVCAFYFALIWLICDWGFGIYAKMRQADFVHYYAGYSAIILSIIALGIGWFLNHHVGMTTYILQTDKLQKPLKIAMFADSHIGTTFDAKGFTEHIAKIQAQNPDIVIVAGDFVDDETKKDDMIAAVKSLGEMKTTYGIYFVFGNHDAGYYGKEYRGYSGLDLFNELKKNGITVLSDTIKLIDNRFYILGRKDASADREGRGGRFKMADLARPLDKSKYIIVVDHQPNDYKNQVEAQVDLVLSGHTHGGQLFPLNRVGKWIGANDKIYGHEKRDKTDFIVTSGISSWAVKFKTGTKSEFVVIEVQPQS